MTSWLKLKLGGRVRVSTAVLLVAFIALFWVYHNFEPTPAATEPPAPAVVPPGFVPDPNYTWVPRTNVRRPKEPEYTTTTTTTSPSPTSPTETSPTTTVTDPDGFGPLPPTTETLTPTSGPSTPPTTTGPLVPVPTPTTTTSPAS